MLLIQTFNFFFKLFFQIPLRKKVSKEAFLEFKWLSGFESFLFFNFPLKFLAEELDQTFRCKICLDSKYYSHYVFTDFLSTSTNKNKVNLYLWQNLSIKNFFVIHLSSICHPSYLWQIYLIYDKSFLSMTNLLIYNKWVTNQWQMDYKYILIYDNLMATRWQIFLIYGNSITNRWQLANKYLI